MTEQWKAVVGHEGYFVSDLGRVQGKSGAILKACRHGKRHLHVTLWTDSKPITRLVHQLVMEAFIGPRPADMECLHSDGDGTNNELVNLRYGTRSQNNFDKVRHGNDHNARKTHCPQGHPYSGRNLIVYRNTRRCRTCVYARTRIAKQRIKAA